MHLGWFFLDGYTNYPRLLAVVAAPDSDKRRFHTAGRRWPIEWQCTLPLLLWPPLRKVPESGICLPTFWDLTEGTVIQSTEHPQPRHHISSEACGIFIMLPHLHWSYLPRISKPTLSSNVTWCLKPSLAPWPATAISLLRTSRTLLQHLPPSISWSISLQTLCPLLDNELLGLESRSYPSL